MIAVVLVALAATAGGIPACSTGAAQQNSSLPPGVGRDPAYHPVSSSSAATVGAPIGRLRCTRDRREWFGAHVEVFANAQVVIVPAGIGVASPFVREGAYVRNGRCSYPVRTFEPTGVLQVDSRTRLTLGDLFAVWGQPLSRSRLVGFRTCGRERVRAYVDGRPWRGDLRAIPLRRRAQIVLEIGDYVPPHRTYRFPRGL